MELAIILGIVILSFIYFRNINSIIYSICIIDIFFRIITKVETLLNIEKFSYYVSKYIPSSISSIIDKYTNGTINTICSWVYVAIYLLFLVLIIKSLFNKKKRRY